MIKKFFGWLGDVILKALGWTTVGQLPTEKCVIIIAPHTSNWDFFYLFVLGLKWQAIGKVVWIGKHSLFWWPLSVLFRKTGGVPVDRMKNNNVIRFVSKLFKERDDMIFALAPEGTRSGTDHWKKGFYHIAKRAGVPLACFYVNFKDKEMGAGPLVPVTGDVEKDWEPIRSFYKREWARYPENFSDMKYD